jgi:hypothetical protein
VWFRCNPYRQLEERIMAAIDDAVARITADVDKLIAALEAATGTGTTNEANAAALNAASDKAETAISAVPVPTPAPAPGNGETNPPPAVGDSGALTPPA